MEWAQGRANIVGLLQDHLRRVAMMNPAAGLICFNLPLRAEKSCCSDVDSNFSGAEVIFNSCPGLAPPLQPEVRDGDDTVSLDPACVPFSSE